MKIAGRGFLIVNETPHYPITIKSYSHLLEFAEIDSDITHPLGDVYRTKIAHPDNSVRMVVVKNDRKYDYLGLGAFIFDRNDWFRYRNPFSPDYNATRVAIDNRMEVIRSKARKVYQPAFNSVLSGFTMVKHKISRPIIRALPRVNKK